jgi:hypothetical protein
MNINKNKSLVLLTVVAALGLAACSDDKAETAGEKMDQAMSDAKDLASDAGDSISDAASDAGDSISDAATDAGNALEDACEDAKDKLDTEDKDC